MILLLVLACTAVGVLVAVATDSAPGQPVDGTPLHRRLDAPLPPPPAADFDGERTIPAGAADGAPFDSARGAEADRRRDVADQEESPPAADGTGRTL